MIVIFQQKPKFNDEKPVLFGNDWLYHESIIKKNIFFVLETYFETHCILQWNEIWIVQLKEQKTTELPLLDSSRKLIVEFLWSKEGRFETNKLYRGKNFANCDLVLTWHWVSQIRSISKDLNFSPWNTSSTHTAG